MQSSLIKIITNANERIYIKTFLLDDKVVNYLINTKNIDIKVSIKNEWLDANDKFIEELFKNDISIFVHDDNESFVIIDDYKIKLDYAKENMNLGTLDKLINRNFKSRNAYLAEDEINNYRINRLVTEIKSEFRLISFSMAGTKIYQRKINFSPLLKKQSKQEVIADEEKFELYDKRFLNNKLKAHKPKKEFSNLEKEYYNLVEICNRFNAFKDEIKNKYSCGKFDKFILISQENINKIIKDINKMNKINKNINERYFNILMNEFYKNFESKLREVLRKHYIHDNKDVENFKKKIRDNIPKAQTIKEKIKIDNFIILELSREMLLNEKVIKQFKEFNIPNYIKDKFSQLEKLLEENKRN